MFSAQQKTDDIAITYYVNPNLFWFKYEVDSWSHEIRKLETQIQHYGESINKKQIVEYSPFVGELVIVRHCSGSTEKWLRARVDHVFKYLTGAEFILWAIDYGFPLKSTSRWIRKLVSRDLQVVENTTIFKGGFMGVPAALEFNFLTYKHEIVKKLMWSEKAIISVEELLFDAETLTFCCETKIKGHGFGDVLVKLHSGKSITLSEYLGKINESIVKSAKTFETEYQSLIHKPYWEYNQHNIFKIQENNFKVSYDDNTELLQASTSTNEELSKKMSDWHRRNAESTDEIIEKVSSWDEENSNLTAHNKDGSSTRVQNDSIDTMSLPTPSYDSLNNKMKSVDISDVPLNKRYDYVNQKKFNEKQKQKSVNRAKDKLARIEKNKVLYPAGYRV